MGIGQRCLPIQCSQICCKSRKERPPKRTGRLKKGYILPKSQGRKPSKINLVISKNSRIFIVIKDEKVIFRYRNISV